MYEIIGIAATLFVLISFLFTNEKRIRQVNIVGAVIFVIYGILIGAISVYLLNGALILIHMYKLYRSRGGKNESDSENQAGTGRADSN